MCVCFICDNWGMDINEGEGCLLDGSYFINGSFEVAVSYVTLRLTTLRCSIGSDDGPNAGSVGVGGVNSLVIYFRSSFG